jgi:hypothetical protein
MKIRGEAHPYKMTEKDVQKQADSLKDWNPKTKKLLLIDGKHFRMRRGKLVEVPAEWVGKVPDNNTKAKRQPISRRTRKSKKERS